VRSRRTGDWQARASFGRPRDESPDETRYWIFVDLGSTLGAPAYFISPEWWIQNNISEVHQKYLARHGGRRARTPESDHHRIPRHRIERWLDQWILLDLI
jgi:hypothetical protein